MKSDSEQRFDGFVRRRGASLLRMAILLSGDRLTGEDLTQATLERLWPRWAKIEVGGDPDRYARTTMINLWRTWRRRRWWREHVSALLPDRPETGDLGDRLGDRETLRIAMARLPAGQRAALVLRFYADLSVAETARTLGCAEGTVKSQTADGLANLRRALAAVNVVGEDR